jgi:hypothetical protein
MIAGALARIHLLLQIRDLLLRGSASEDSAIVRGKPLQRHARAVDLPHVRRREAAHRGAAKLLEHDQPFGLKPLQRLADAGARGSGLAGAGGDAVIADDWRKCGVSVNARNRRQR